MYQAFKDPIHFHHYWLSIFKWRSRLTVIIRHFVNTFHDIDVANPSALFNSNERNFVLVTFLKLLSQREGYLSFPHTWFCAFLKNSLVCQSLQISHSSFQPKKYRRNKWFKNHLAAVLPNYTNIVSIGFSWDKMDITSFHITIDITIKIHWKRACFSKMGKWEY